MLYTLDTEFIDTPSCSALISLALVREDGAHLYFEFDYPADEITPWLKENVVPHLAGYPVERAFARDAILDFVGGRPEFWCYFGSYDWYFFCRLFGGFMQMPQHWPHIYFDLAHAWRGEVPNMAGAEHNALNDALSILAAVRQVKNRNQVR